jgi:AcrR family transcriptional regulator
MKRRVGRPRGRVLSRGLIFEAGLKLLDERGPHGFGMRDIARELGVQPSALYNHVSGHDEVIAGVRELIGDRIDASAFGQLPWNEALAAWAISYRDAFAAHPPTIALLAVTPVLSDSRIGLMYERVLSALEQAGWPQTEVLSVMVALESFVLGSALDVVAGDEILDPGNRTDVPTFTAAHAARRAAIGDRRPADVAFELGLAVMIDGLGARLSRLVPSSVE